MNARFDFTGKTLLLTGATGGIGRQIAALFHQSGANIILMDLDAAQLESVRAQLAVRVVAVAGDATASEAIQEALRLGSASFGEGIDFVVPAAGIYPESSILDTGEDLWRKVMSINLDGVYRLLQASIPRMNDGGAIVNFASVAGHRGSKNHGHYAASKGAILALTRSLAHEVGPKLRVNAVSPGTIRTPMVESLVAAKGAAMLSETPLARYGEAAEVASVVAFLCSDAASFMTGEALHVNGGLFMAG
ncbi:SDR family NAD(P)-dependent oxidoreductase [Paeniglutamicibacter sulfureus]|uniref:SDR family NAD(P)-dependent oxidoreductase n=1 Tax=Paeniglutamicibacter sulfureus TaxID=43666 RepID=UPI002666EF3C|nr:SDR family NAD(P)-dependent oxidoreductase [Paeniglutamicibacter sulfureus]MDO2934671.1 SDR family NAD(P)-dependent oxidoreductase [Paeniglutamicibacter sulfureus]